MQNFFISKILFACLLCLLIGNAVQAQCGNAVLQMNGSSFSENFDSGIPASWLAVNNSSPLGNQPWFQGNTTVFDAYNGATNTYAGVNYNSGASLATISNWLIMPNITISNGDVFSFYTRTVSTPAFPDRLQLRMSTNGASINVGATATSEGDFTILLLDINPTLTTSGYPNAWTQYSVTIAGLGAPVSGRLAFRYFVTNAGPSGDNSDYIGIDAVSYTSVASAPTTFCVGGSTAIKANITGGAGPYTVVYTDGTTNTTVSNYISGAAINVSPTANATYSLVSVTDAANCSTYTTSGSLPITVNPPAAQPVLVSPVSSPTTICPGATATLEASALADHTIEWRWFSGAFGGPVASSTSNPLTTPSLSSTRTYYAFQQNSLTGCWSETGTPVRINISALPSALAGADRLVCPGTNTNIGPGTAVSGWSYSWSPSNLLSSTTANRPTVQNVPPDFNQDYTLTVTNGLGCSATDVVNVSAHGMTNLLAATDAGTNATVCSGQPAMIGGAPTAGFTYTWTPFAALDNRYSSMPTHLFNSTSSTAATVTTYTLTVRETTTGCAATDQVSVTTNPLPASSRVNAGADQTIVEGGSTVIGGGNAVAGLTYSWSPATGLSSATAAKPTANPTSTTTYTITVSNSFGCSRSDDMLLTVVPVRTGELGDKIEVLAYPNPVQDALHLSSNLPMNGNLSILMVNELGQTVLNLELSLSDNTLNEELDIRQLTQGVYTVIVRSAEGESSFKVVKE